MPGLECSCTVASGLSLAKQFIYPCNGSVRTIVCIDRPEDQRLKNDYSSSGSEHEPAGSACLVDMEMGFMEEEEEDAQAANTCAQSESQSNTASTNFHPSVQICSQSTQAMASNAKNCKPILEEQQQQYEILKGVISCSSQLEMMIMGRTVEALEMAKENAFCICQNEDLQCRKSCLRRTVMKHLRIAGYDAAICKTRCKYTESFPAGDYEYIDVILTDKTNSNTNSRHIVDIDFKAQFEMARPTREYSFLVQLLPNIFVGKPERLQTIIKLMCDALKLCLKKNGLMYLPPWRKYKYMQSKWLGSYNRTIDPALMKATHQSSNTNINKALLREIPSIALRCIDRDPKFIHHMGLYSEKAFREAVRAAKRKQNEQPELLTSDYITTNSETNDVCMDSSTGFAGEKSVDWKPPAEPAMDTRRRLNISGLAKALKEAGLTTSSRTTQLHLSPDFALTVF
eukprot:Gb_28137 [translate_table: standard]